MIDGVSIRAKLSDYHAWESSLPMDLANDLLKSRKNLILKERDKYRCQEFEVRFRSYFVNIKRIFSKGDKKPLDTFYLRVSGSLHKNHVGENFGNFSLQGIRDELDFLKNVFHLPDATTISTVEIGINIEFDFRVMNYLRKNLLSYKNNYFEQYQPGQNGKSIGFFYRSSAYVIKLYDKALQYNLPNNIMRFEVAIKKGVSKYGILTINDLYDSNKIKDIASNLKLFWEDVYFLDPLIKSENISEKEIKIIAFTKNVSLRNALSSTKYRSKVSRNNQAYKKLIAEKGSDFLSLVEKEISRQVNLIVINSSCNKEIRTENCVAKQNTEVASRVTPKNVARNLTKDIFRLLSNGRASVTQTRNLISRLPLAYNVAKQRISIEPKQSQRGLAPTMKNLVSLIKALVCPCVSVLALALERRIQSPERNFPVCEKRFVSQNVNLFVSKFKTNRFKGRKIIFDNKL